MSRRYPMKDIKMLFALSAGRCAFPGCRVECIEPATNLDDAVVLGKIAHIEAHSDEGPRANPNLTQDQRDCNDNWILLCGNHHDLIDAQSNTYTVEEIKRWKTDHENWVNLSLVSSFPHITYVELEFIAQAIMVSNVTGGLDDMNTIPPPQKLQKNGLSSKSARYLKMGLVQSELVNKYVAHTAILQPDFPEKLRSGFVQEYYRLRNEEGLLGDELFFGLLEFSHRGHADFLRQAAGLAILAYFFHICEVFEK